MILHLNYDLTQKYRRTQIYQNKSFISEDCDYDSIDLDFNKIKMKCKYKQSLDYSYIQKESVLKISNEKTLKNLSFKCVKYVKQIYMNIGFWIHLILITLGIIIEIIFSLNEKQNLIKGMKYDLERNDKAFDIRKSNSSNNKNTYFKIFSENIGELYPIINLKNLSNFFPFYLKCNCFIFNILQIFFINSILYSEKIIERRIYNKNRSNIFYPITNEYGKLLLSIIISMVCLFIIKLIIFIEQKYILRRRLIAKIIILIFSLFSFFYVTVFCSIYRKLKLIGFWEEFTV